MSWKNIVKRELRMSSSDHSPLLDDDYVKEFISGKVIVVTGGTGSIGIELVKRLVRFEPNAVRILSNDENSLFEAKMQLQEYVSKVGFLLGDVRDEDRLKMAMRGVDMVFHAAAVKHIDLCEYNPFEAVKTNVLGTQNILNASLLEDVEKFMLISTDKAVDPSSTLGATKLLCERLTLDAHSYRGSGRTIFSCVRFGNVMGSRGSVFHIFSEQIKKGGPVTITHKDMTRFVMMSSEATDLIIKAAVLAKGGEIFILKMPAIKLTDLADVMIQELAPRFNLSPDSIQIKVTGLRAGEKMHEQLLTPEEKARSDDMGDMYRINFQDNVTYTVGNTDSEVLSSESSVFLSRDDIRKLIHNLIQKYHVSS